MSENKSDNMENPVSPIELAAWAVVSERIDTDAVARVKEKAKRLASERAEPSIPPADEDDNTAKPNLVQRKRNSSRFVSWLVRGGIAAAIAGVVLATSLLPGDNSAAFAAALKKLELVKVFSFDMFIHSEDFPEPILAHVTVCEDGRQRLETKDMVTLNDSTGMPRLQLVPDAKIAIEFNSDAFKEIADIGDAAGDMTGVDGLAWYRELKDIEGDNSIDLGENSIDLGENSLDGIAAFGKEVQVEKHRLQVWVNAETEELIMVEHFFPDDTPIEKMIVKNFNFNEDVDEKLFSLDVPEGYMVQTISDEIIELIQKPEQHAIELMQIHADLTDGKLPISLSNWEDWFEVLVVEPTDDGVEGQVNTEVAGKLGGFTPFLSSMKKENYGYLGDGVFLNQDERVIVFWYKNPEGQLRAIYSDMTTGDITEGDIPEPKESSPPPGPSAGAVGEVLPAQKEIDVDLPSLYPGSTEVTE